MPADLEILIPARNPTEVFARTIESLVVQSTRDFRVLISDNFSTQGSEHLEQARKALADAGITVEKIQPPSELQRVEHWNWLHVRSNATWVKPLFAGDWLEPHAAARWQEAIAGCPEARFIHFGYHYHEEGAAPVSLVGHCVSRFRPPEEMHDYVLRFGHQFGPPNAVLYLREAMLAGGGFRTTLPICADSLLCCQLARRFGALGIPEVLSHFRLHGARFSMTLPGRPEALLREKMIYLPMLAYQAWTENRPVPWLGFIRQLAREVRSYLRESKMARPSS